MPEPLPDWPAGTTCGAMRAFKYHLIAMNIEAPGGPLGTQLLWSDAADPGDVPSSWTPTPENEAGSTTLAATPGAIVDGHPLRDNFVICKQHSTYLMQYVAGEFVFLFRKALVTSGALARNCMAEVLGNLLVMTDGDIVLFDGRDATSIVQNRLKRWIFNIIDGDNFGRSFVVAHPAQSEVWVCFPETGNTHPNLAAVWDRNRDAWGVRELYPQTTYIASGILPDAGVDQAWDADGQAWDLDDSLWKSSAFNPTHDGLVSGDEPGTALIEVDAGLTHWDGTDVTGAIAKESMLLDDTGARKLITAVWPRIDVPVPTVFEVRVGVQNHYTAPISWSPIILFDPDVDERVDVLLTGRYLSVSFLSRSTARWRLDGFSVEVTGAGAF